MEIAKIQNHFINLSVQNKAILGLSLFLYTLFFFWVRSSMNRIYRQVQSIQKNSHLKIVVNPQLRSILTKKRALIAEQKDTIDQLRRQLESKSEENELDAFKEQVANALADIYHGLESAKMTKKRIDLLIAKCDRVRPEDDTEEKSNKKRRKIQDSDSEEEDDVIADPDYVQK